MIVRTGKDNWAGYRPVLDLARHPNIMYASLPQGSWGEWRCCEPWGASRTILPATATAASAVRSAVQSLTWMQAQRTDRLPAAGVLWPSPLLPGGRWRLTRAAVARWGGRMKISDVHNRSNEAYPHADMKECVQLAVGAFGKERVMWGTGYPDTAHRVASGARLDATLRCWLMLCCFFWFCCLRRCASICELRCFWLVLREAASCHGRG